MKIFPVIDIKDKKCVRLVKGDFVNKVEFYQLMILISQEEPIARVCTVLTTHNKVNYVGINLVNYDSSALTN